MSLLKVFFILSLLVMSNTSCSRTDGTSLPEWLETDVKKNEYLEVWLFQHRGQPAYYLVPSGYHGNDTVYLASGEYICSPVGYAGGDNKCPSTALADPGTKIILVWPHPSTSGEKFTAPPLHIPTEKSHDPVG